MLFRWETKAYLFQTKETDILSFFRFTFLLLHSVLLFYHISFKLSEMCKERSAYCRRYQLIFVRTSTLNPKGHRPCTVSKGNRSARTRSDNHANWIALVVAAGIKCLIILGMNYSVYKSVSCLAGSKVATSSTRHQSRPFEIWCRRTYPKYRITDPLWWIMQKNALFQWYILFRASGKPSVLSEF